MTSGLEAVGDAATGAIIAQEVEPEHGESADAAHEACPNCGTELVGAYCQDCGQNSHLHRTVAGFLHDLLHGVFHFEGKIWQTLPMLLFKPGELTRRYIAGERVKFVSPLAMFLFCVFLMFAVVGSLAGEMHDIEINSRLGSDSVADLDKALAKNKREAAALDKWISAEKKRGGDTAAMAEQRVDLEEKAKAITLARSVAPVKGGGGSSWPALDRGIKAAKENPNLFFYRLQTSAYKYSWLLIPILTPLVWLLFFWKRQYKVYDHLVFVTFSLTFMLLLVTTLTLAGALGLPAIWIVLAALIIPPLHSYKQMRGAYLSGRTTALLRTGALMLFGVIALILYLIILLLLGVTH